MVDIITPTMSRMNRRREYPPAGRCIYCGRSDVPLALEHIIPESLGGTLLLPQASCSDCAVITGAFEGKNAGNLFRPIRRQFGFPSKHRGRASRQRTVGEVFRVTADGRKVDVPVSEFPGLMMSFRFAIPSIFYGGTPTTGFAGKVALAILPEFGERLNALKAKLAANSISFHPQGNAELVGRLLAKIAHAYAVAELGPDAFQPTLLDIILNRPPMYFSHFIGSAMGSAGPATDLHELSFEETGFGGADLVTVKIRLFATRDMPMNYVVAGRRLAPKP